MRTTLADIQAGIRDALIDGNTMTMSWPSRGIRQVTDIATPQGRIQKYFVNGTADDLRREFAIEDHGAAGDRPNAYSITMVPKRRTRSVVSLWRASLRWQAIR